MKTIINYMWLGDISTEQRRQCCEMGPKSLATHDKKSPIKVWIQASAKEGISSLFTEYENIDVCTIEDFLQSKLTHISPYIDSINEFLEKMLNDKLYTFAKDLLSLAVIAEYGGVFLDCTTQFTAKPDFSDVIDFKIFLKSISLPFVIDYLASNELSSPHFAESYYKEVDSRDLPIWYDTDVWIFAAAQAGHPVFLNAIKKSIDCYRDVNSAMGADPWQVTVSQYSFIQAIIHNVDTYPEWTDLIERVWFGVSTERGIELPQISLNKFFYNLYKQQSKAEQQQKAFEVSNLSMFSKTNTVNAQHADEPNVDLNPKSK